MNTDLVIVIAVGAVVFSGSVSVCLCLLIALKRIVALHGMLEASRGRVTDLEVERQLQQEELCQLRKKLRRAEIETRVGLINWAEEKAKGAFLEGQLRIVAALRLVVETVTRRRFRGLLKEHFYQIRLMIGERTMVHLTLSAPGAGDGPINLLPGIGIDITNLLP